MKSFNYSDKIKCSPLGAALGAVGSAMGAGINAASNASLQEKQMQHDIDMAAINQLYNLQNMEKQHGYNMATMEQQNQYQLDQWNRENEYNDPTAVAKRYREAGINPRAAFGNGSASGAGVAGGFSGAPSGGAPSGSGSLGSASTLPGGNQFAGLFSHLGVDINQAMLNNANIRSINADAVGKEIDNQTKSISNLLDIDLKIQELENKKAQKGLTEKEIEKIDADITYLGSLREKIASDITVNEQEVKEGQQRARKLGAEAERVEAENELYKKFGVRPGMTLEEALVSIGANVLGTGREYVEKKIREQIGYNKGEAKASKSMTSSAYSSLADELSQARLSQRGTDNEERFFNFVHNVLANYKY